MAHNFCCAHPQQRIDSPEPPSRPPLKIDGLLAAAALPEGHPHALKFPDKKPELDSSIIRSPNIADKLKWQFRRKSTKALRSDEEYDLDAQPLTSTEVVNEVGYIARELPVLEVEPARVQHTPPSVRMLSTPASLDDWERRSEVRDSVFKSLAWLRPMLESVTPSELAVVPAVEGRVAPRQVYTEILASPPPMALLPQSLSSPNLLDGRQESTIPLRRTQSSFAFGTLLKVPKIRSARSSVTTGSSDTLRQPGDSATHSANNGTHPADTLLVQNAQTEAIESEARSHGNGSGRDCADEVSTGPRLQTMDISHQLRSMSALSEPSEEEDSLLSANEPWNFHRREKSALSGSSNRTRHARQPSSLTTHVLNERLERVRSPAASSNYSRPSSYFDHAPIDNDLAERMLQTHEVPCALDGACTDWPLPMPATDFCARTGDTTVANEVILSREDNAAPAFFVNPGGEEDSSVKWSSPLRRDVSTVPSKDSSSHLTISSMRSRLRDRFTSTKKLVRKRRSIFKFLRPGSRKHQGRSISSPMLRTKNFHGSAYDGPSDDPESVVVEYELMDNPQHATISSRSASFSHLGQRRGTAAHLEVPTTLLPQRRPSLADYERSLTAAGDDRRRPSTINMHKLQEVEQDDRRHSMLLRRKLSRAKPLNDEPTAGGLMAQALEKHQEEKALFRSASKQKEAREANYAAHETLFRTETLDSRRASLSPMTPGAYGDMLDPFEKPAIKISEGRSHSTGYLLPPGPAHDRTYLSAPVFASSPLASTETSIKTSVRRLSYLSDHLPAPPKSANRIGTSVPSWARFSSHTRAERCGSAGRLDAVIARDFALDTEATDRTGPDDLDPASPVSKKSGKGKSPPAKRRSTTFGGLVRYYSNIFSSGASPQNRRSSITTGGWLANPDLEMLPPASSNEPTFPHHDHSFKERLHQLEHDLEERVMEDVAYVEGEAVKLEEQIREDVEYVEKEAVKLEETIRKDVGEIEREAETLMHIKPHQNHHQQGLIAKSLFTEGSRFGESSGHSGQLRASVCIDPIDDEEIGTPSAFTVHVAEAPKTANNHSERVTTLDGTVDAKMATSKAEAWSNVYQKCLLFRSTESTGPTDSRIQIRDTALSPADGVRQPPSTQHSMGPPLLKPTKARSPQHVKGLDPNSTVRRFPSVTVVDDQKGHGRSISLISVNVGCDGVMRSSTNDLIDLIQAREREEREKLLRGPSRASTMTGGGS
ncbi:hypothetical protein LTR91_014336 [Friedmanniomyces endolithicus]|uniref:Uncharacterized protein n=1 Tax=Friedmanniomyces endolithicus TaxID=329885 RepID=A0AAN6QNJ1_9PEZI|nr:hypothetical protein LTR94_007201 [Friedmanniomyces endolithicus]KAK0794107.1 hypothetical protein LTR59_007979 [Friedmanniomyces endolithicus]KAK0805869.1 hypothetical protein LTR38_005403 [Friedmanniomyces endolithicus]KAK0868014.1 hypothetical protein LTS02_003770 [Friedmanniomyces endolithicus]KAK0874974.1 hypothetical protein LTR87_011153 [Friedmanniomyces endolithicus]